MRITVSEHGVKGSIRESQVLNILDHLTDYYEAYKAFNTFFGLVTERSSKITVSKLIEHNSE